MTQYFDELEIMLPDERDKSLLQRLTSQIDNAKNNASFYQDHFSKQQTNEITSLDHIANLPVIRKSQLQAQQIKAPPFAGVLPSNTELGNVFASPGPIYEPSTRRSNYWRFARALFAAGLRKGDLAINCFSYHLSPAGAMGETGCHALGCAVIPGGVGQTELQLQTIHDLKPSAYVGTPSFLKIIIEKAKELNLDVSCIKNALVAGEAFPVSLRTQFEAVGIHALQCYATAELGLIAYESSADSGLIVDEDIYLEIVRPGTDDPLAAGEVGEVVVTTLNPDYPLIRFGTGDLSATMSGISECGRTNRRIKGWMGRADQTAKVRGMFVRPEQINKLVKRHSQLQRAKLVIDWVDQADQMTLHCETGQPSDELINEVANSIRDICKVRGEVKLVEPNSLENDGLVIADIRKYD